LISHDFASELINRASPILEKSFVMGGSNIYETSNIYSTSSSSTESNIKLDSQSPIKQVVMTEPYRSSYTAWLSSTTILERLKITIAELTDIPLPYLLQKFEDLQVVKYNEGGQFNVHHDSSTFHSRLFTLLIYLTDSQDIFNDPSCKSSSSEDKNNEKAIPDVISGGTWFPFARPSEENGFQDSLVPSSVEEAINIALKLRSETIVSGNKSLPGLVIRPQIGNAILFFNHLKTGELDPLAVHAGLPVGSKHLIGEKEITAKWIANLWISHDPQLLSQFL
jgi:hypothetical protein